MDLPTTNGSAALLAKLIDEEAVADSLGISRRHLTYLRQRRLIPYVKLGRCVRFNPVDVSQAVTALTVKPKPIQ
jgi:hypothetical protein